MTLNLLFVSVTFQRRIKSQQQNFHEIEVGKMYETQKQKQFSYYPIM
ncbi:YrzI family small protein [Bacillus spongiae]|uniref:YrzI family small protein n=1 Tax=Bacillus spongiae TaxID=2683610 RepID=A0ABU8H8W1_9BACI